MCPDHATGVISMPNGKPNILVIWGDDIGITARAGGWTVVSLKNDWSTVFAGRD
jgi:hypothetical protein